MHFLIFIIYTNNNGCSSKNFIKQLLKIFQKYNNLNRHYFFFFWVREITLLTHYNQRQPQTSKADSPCKRFSKSADKEKTKKSVDFISGSTCSNMILIHWLRRFLLLRKSTESLTWRPDETRRLELACNFLCFFCFI